MTFEGFTEEVKKNIRDYLPEEYADAEVSVTRTQKLNQSYPALIVRMKGDEITPSINLDQFYDMWQNGESYETVMGSIAECVQQRPEMIELVQFTDYDRAKENLFIRVSDAENNKELLADVPHKEVSGLAITYHILASLGGDGMGSTMVNNGLLKEFGVTAEQLHNDALTNSQRILPPVLQPMEAVLGRLMGMEMGMEVPQAFESQVEELNLSRDSMAVLTNRESVNGAAVIFYPDVLKMIGDHEQTDLFVIPSSIHEVILVADNGALDRHELEGMIKSINDTEVSSKDKLSDTLYHYDSKEHILEKASDFADRIMEMNDEPDVKAKGTKERTR